MDESALQSALATRINLQIVISSVPSISEEMDLPLSRWLDSVPLPPELPEGEGTNLVVLLGSDLTRMSWSAYGPPAAFIPKMAQYFQKSGMTEADLDLINAMGDAMEPNQVGSWIRAGAAGVVTGWQFREPMPVEVIAPFLGEGFLVTKLMSWTVKRDIVNYASFRRSVGEGARSQLELVLPEGTAAERLALVADGFADLAEIELPPSALEVLARDGDDVSLALEFEGDRITGASVFAPGPGLDQVSEMCSRMGVAYSDKIGQLARMLGADGTRRIEVRVSCDGGPPEADLELVPGELQGPPAPPSN